MPWRFRDDLDAANRPRPSAARRDRIVISPIFMSHAVPWLLAGDPRLARVLASIGTDCSPDAVIVANAHWHTEHPTVAVFDRDDPLPGRTARRVAESLERAGFQSAVTELHKEAFDFHHSLWVPLSMMFGESLPPVVSLSVQPSRGVAHHLRVGEALREMTEATLVVGSGSLTHNMVDVRPAYPAGRYADWALAFSGWMTKRVCDGDVEAVLDYRNQAPGAEWSHPEEDHLLPLFVAMGASRLRRGRVLYEGVALGTVSLNSYSFS